MIMALDSGPSTIIGLVSSFVLAIPYNSLRRFRMGRLKLKNCVLIIILFVLITCSTLFLVDWEKDSLIFKYEPMSDDSKYRNIEDKLDLYPTSGDLVELVRPGDPDQIGINLSQKELDEDKEIEAPTFLDDKEKEPPGLAPELHGNGKYKENIKDGEKIELNLMKSVNIYTQRYNIKTYNKKSAKNVVIPNGGLIGDFGNVNNKHKHLLILGHYEQLGKTTINFFDAARLAYLTDRKIVKPFVRNSRFCGLIEGWTGMKRKNTRAFFPLDLYYNTSSMYALFRAARLADMEYLSTFRKSCAFANGKRKVTLVYFFYERRITRRVLALSNNELDKIEKSLYNSSGWIDCSFINDRIKTDERIGGGIQLGKQYCVDPEKIIDIKDLEDKIFKNDPCVVIHQWRGIGEHRNHFNLTHLVSTNFLLRSLVPSDFVIAEVHRFIAKLGPKFIGVHIRSERQLLWYGLDKFSKCMDLVYREVKKVKKAKNIKRIFLSADIGPYGSDQISPNFNSSAMNFIRNKYKWLSEKLGVITYSVVKPKHHVWTDSGLVAFVQFHILSRASHLVTLGNGTFQKWMTDTFKQRKSAANDKSWSITRTCFSELKRWKFDMKKTAKNN